MNTIKESKHTRNNENVKVRQGSRYVGVLSIACVILLCIFCINLSNTGSSNLGSVSRVKASDVAEVYKGVSMLNYGEVVDANDNKDISKEDVTNADTDMDTISAVSKSSLSADEKRELLKATVTDIGKANVEEEAITVNKETSIQSVKKAVVNKTVAVEDKVGSAEVKQSVSVENKAVASEPVVNASNEYIENGVKYKTINGLKMKYLGKFKLSFYCPCAQCCGKCTGITASGRKATAGTTIAVDTRVIPLGSSVYIDGYGMRRADDTGGAIKSNKIDVFMSSHNEALSNGIKTGIDVWVAVN